MCRYFCTNLGTSKRNLIVVGGLCEDVLGCDTSISSSSQSPTSSQSSTSSGPSSPGSSEDIMVTHNGLASHAHIQDLPSPNTPQGCQEAFQKLTLMINGLRGDGLEPEVLISNLEYIQEVLGVLAQKAE